MEIFAVNSSIAYLILACLHCDEKVNWQKQKHDNDTADDRVTNLLPQEKQSKRNLKARLNLSTLFKSLPASALTSIAVTEA